MVIKNVLQQYRVISVIMLSVEFFIVMLSVVMLNIVVPVTQSVMVGIEAQLFQSNNNITVKGLALFKLSLLLKSYLQRTQKLQVN